MRKLYDSHSDKIAILSLSANKLLSETGKEGKTKTSEKAFASPTEAGVQLVKKEAELLRKGYVYRNPDAKTGEALMHSFTKNIYTGAMWVIAMPEGFMSNKNGDIYKKELDELLWLNEDGTVKQSIGIPKNLIWDAVYNAPSQTIFLNIDHSIYEYNLQTQHLRQLTGRCDKPLSFLSQGSSHVAYYTHPNLTIIDGTNDKIILEQKVEAGQHGSYSHLLQGVISKNNTLLALCDKMGEIQLRNTASFALETTINADFESLGKMLFINNDQQLLIKDRGILAIDLNKKTAERLPFVPSNMSICDYCLSADESRLAVAELMRNQVHIYDFKTGNLLHSLNLEHCVKRAAIAFVGNEKLAVRADYGTLSLYRV